MDCFVLFTFILNKLNHFYNLKALLFKKHITGQFMKACMLSIDHDRYSTAERKYSWCNNTKIVDFLSSSSINNYGVGLEGHVG